MAGNDMIHPLKARVEGLQTLYPGQFSGIITAADQRAACSLFARSILDRTTYSELRRAASQSEGLSTLFAEYEQGGLDEAGYAWLLDSCHRYRLFPTDRQNPGPFYALVHAFDTLQQFLPPSLKEHDILLATNSTYHATARLEFASPSVYAIVLSDRHIAAAHCLMGFYFHLFDILRKKHDVALDELTAAAVNDCLQRNPHLVLFLADIIAFTYFGEKYALALPFSATASNDLARQAREAMICFLLGHELHHVVEDDPAWAHSFEPPDRSEVMSVLSEHAESLHLDPDELPAIADRYDAKVGEHMFEFAADAAACFWVVRGFAAMDRDINMAFIGSVVSLLLVKYIDLIDDTLTEGHEQTSFHAHPLLPDILSPEDHPRGGARVLHVSEYLYEFARDLGVHAQAEYWSRLHAALEVPFETAIGRAIAQCKRVQQFPGELFIILDEAGNRHINMYEDLRLADE